MFPQVLERFLHIIDHLQQLLFLHLAFELLQSLREGALHIVVAKQHPIAVGFLFPAVVHQPYCITSGIPMLGCFSCFLPFSLRNATSNAFLSFSMRFSTVTRPDPDCSAEWKKP